METAGCGTLNEKVKALQLLEAAQCTDNQRNNIMSFVATDVTDAADLQENKGAVWWIITRW